MSRPDPFAEIRETGARLIRHPNYWSRRPVARLDLAPGAYDEISSADVPGLTDTLVGVLPGLREHRCSVGRRGGFVERLRRGTYAPHIIEHVAIDLQNSVGHDVAFGRARGGDRDGEYTVVVEYRHPEVGQAALRAAMRIVRSALAGRDTSIRSILGTLSQVATEPPSVAPEPISPDRLIVSGWTGRLEVEGASEVWGISLPDLLADGIPYIRCSEVVVGELEPDRLPPRYREEDRLARLVAVAGDALAPGGIIAVPSSAEGLIARLRRERHRVRPYDPAEGVPPFGRLSAPHAVSIAHPTH